MISSKFLFAGKVLQSCSRVAPVWMIPGLDTATLRLWHDLQGAGVGSMQHAKLMIDSSNN